MVLALASMFSITSAANAATVATPTFSPIAGTYANTQTVTIACATSGATIRYTTNGTAPTTTTGTVYSAAVSISSTATLKAIAYKTGSTTSAVKSGTYTLTAAAPVFSPVAGTYPNAQTVTITSATSGATIRYTTNGTAPTATSGTVYSAAVSIASTATLKAIAYKTGYTNSSVTSGVYTINLTAAAPTFSPVAGTYASAQTVTIASATSGATIRYTTDGSTPTSTVGTVYSAPVSIGATATLKAIAYKTGYTNSSVTSGAYTINLTAAAPTFSPVAGTYTSAQTVTIASTTSGATIRYTTDGSTPTATVGTVYSTAVSIGASATLKAIAYKTGYTNSSVTSGTYTINLTAAAPTFSPVAGTYTSAQTVTITSTTSGASIRYTTDGSTPSSTVGTIYSTPVPVGTTTTLKAIAYKSGYVDSVVTSGTYTLNLTAVAPTFGPVAGTYTSAQTVTIASSTSGVSIRYTTDGSTPSATVGTVYSAPVSIGATATLKAVAYKTGYTSSSVTSGTYTINLTAAAPTFSPVAGTFTSPQTVTIASTTSGASIRYTTDGSTPTATTGTVYSAPVTIGATTTLKAIAYLAGYTSSTVTSGIYTINLPTTVAPTFSLPAGTYSSAQTVAITSATSGALIRYTTDGSTPSATIGTVYSAPVSINATTTLKAIAYLTGYKNSTVTSSIYTMSMPAVDVPAFSPFPGVYTYVPTVEITSTTSDALIAYTTDGTTPTASGGVVTHGTLYSAPVIISATTTLKAIAFASGFADSAVTSGTYTLNLPVADAPLFFPDSGTYSSPLNVAMATSKYATTSDGYTVGQFDFSVAYTTDGTAPTASGGVVTHGTLYTGPVPISATTTFKAIAFDLRCAPSSVASRTYVIKPAASVPVFTPGVGTYANALSVTITSATSGASILYTTDGSTPTQTHGTIYSGPVTISSTTMLKAIAYVSGSYGNSPVASGLYAITSAPASTLNVLYDFSPTNSGGLNPWASLVQGSDGHFYGTAQFGGSAGSGAIFKITQAGAFTPLVSFNGANGASPQAALAHGTDGNFYGTTYYGGSADRGTVFKITPAGVLNTLYSFGGPDGTNPEAGLVQGSDGNLYGMTNRGGTAYPTAPAGFGTIFRITPAGGFTTLVYSASYPTGDLMLSRDGNFYGHGSDNVFKMTPSGVVTGLFSFYGANKGSTLYGGLVQGNDDNFYGTTMFGGAGSEGTVFKMTPVGVVNTIVSFDGTNGQNPAAGLVMGKNGNFYGTTSGGFDGAAGTLFKINPAGVLTNLFSFNGANGANPYAALVQGSDGNFYGTTYAGGTYNFGTVFQLVIPTTIAPIFNPAPDTYFAAQPLTISSTTPGATIRYTVDGSAPSSISGTIYSGPISLSTTTTLKAIAYANNLDDSSVTTGTYLTNLQTVAPVFSPSAGTYHSSQSVAMTSSTSGATIRYTTDGSIPTQTTGTIYTGPVDVGATTTLKAIAYSSSLTPSLVTSGYFLINQPPVITTRPYPGPGTVFSPSGHVTLNFIVSDSDGAVSKLEIFRDGVLVSTLISPSSGSTWSFTEAGTLALGNYTYYALAYDSQGASTRSDNVIIAILPSLPYTADFEVGEGYSLGTLSTQLGWNVTAGAAQITASGATHGTQSIVLNAGVTAGQAEQKFCTTQADCYTSFIDFYAKPVAGIDVNTGTLFDCGIGRIAFVRNGATGQFFALDGDGAGAGTWKPLAPVIALDPNQVAATWQRVTVHSNIYFDYEATYDVYLNGQMVAAGLKFCSYGTSGFTIRGATTADTSFDDLYIGLANPLFTDANYNGIDDAWETAHGLSISYNNRFADADGDGLNNIDEYIARTDPTDYYNGASLPAPTITQIAGASFSVNLGWTPLPRMGPAIYEIERKSGAGAFAKVGEVAKLVTFTDRTVVDGQSYTYRVHVRTSGAWSVYSNELSVNTQVFPKTGLKVWLDANTCTPGPVSSWTDRNDSIVKAQQTLNARQPIAIAGALNGYPVIRFDGVDDSLALTNVLNGASAGEILGVVRVTTLSGTVVNRLWSFGTGSGSSYYNDSRYEDFGTNEDNPHSGTPLSGQFHITDVSVSNGALCERVNGVVNWSRDGASIGFNSAPVIGSSLTNANTVFSGDIAELLVYNRELTPAERIMISEYLVDKYALESVPVPAAPSLTAQANLNNQVMLSWSASPAGLYTTASIERSTGNGEFVVLAQMEQETTYVDSPVITGGHYSYRIRFKGLAGLSGYSNTVSLIVPISTAIISTVSGSSLTALSGNWIVDGTSLVAQSIRGSLNCNLLVNTAGLYALDIIVRDGYVTNSSNRFELEMWIDGVNLGTLNITASGATPGTGQLILPWLIAGTHSVKLIWHNGRAGTLLRVDSIQLVCLDQTDADSNGEPDWMAPYFESTFSFDNSPVQSCVSPYTVEGKSAYPSFVKLNSVYQTTPVSAATEWTVRQGLSTQFFADVSLNSSASTKITVVEANGLRIGTKVVTWKPLNLVAPVAATMTVRKDSRILVEASNPLTPTAAYQLRIISPSGEVSTPSLASTQNLEVLFDQVGDYRIYLTPEGGIEVSALAVTVRQLSLSPVPVLVAGLGRSLQWGSLPPGPVIQTDPTMYAIPSIPPTTPQTFTIGASMASRAILRLDGDTGPIVDAVTVNPIRNYSDEQSTAQKVKTLPDGTNIYRLSINFDGPIPSDLRVVLRPFTGAMFSDGSMEKIVTASDIGSDGRYEYFVYAKAGSCHRVAIYIGSNELLYSY